jgi:hypothetical protein
VGCIGLVLVCPLTSLISAFMYASPTRKRTGPQGGQNVIRQLDILVNRCIMKGIQKIAANTRGSLPIA